MKISEAALAELKSRKRCDDVAGQWVKLRKHGKKFVGPCPLHSPDPDAPDSTSFECGAESWVCAVCHDGGDVLRLVALRHGLDPRADFRAVVDLLGGVAELSAERAAELERERAERKAQREKQAHDYREQERRRAFEIWHAGEPWPGTPVEAYLRQARGIAVLPDPPARLCLRYAPSVAFFHGEEMNERGRMAPRVIHRGPAMLAPIVDGDGRFRGVQIKWLDATRPNGKALIINPDTNAPVEKSQKIRGSVTGNVIPLIDAPDAEAEAVIVIAGEGTETVLSAYSPLAAAGRDLSRTAFRVTLDMGNLGGKAAATVRHPTAKDKANRTRRVPGPAPDDAKPFALPGKTTHVVLIGDGDSDPFETRCALRRGSKRLERDRGVLVDVAMASDSSDLNDDLRQRGADAVLAILDAAAPIEDPTAGAEAEDPRAAAPAAAANDKPARRQARTDRSYAGAAGDPGAPGAASNVVSFAGNASPPPSPPIADDSAATLQNEPADNGGPPNDDDGVPIELKLQECSRLDHSDVDNGARLRCYFGDDLLVRKEAGTPAGAWLHWDGKHWDMDNGTAGAALLGQRVGPLIMQEARFIDPTKAEQCLIESAEDAARELKAVGADEEAAEQKEKVAALKILIAEGIGAKKAVAARRQARRKWGLGTKNRGRMVAMLECAAPFLRRSPDDFNADPLLVATSTHTLRFVQRPDPECPDPDAVRLKWTVDAIAAHRRDDLITALVPVTYDEEAKCPKWRANLERFQPSEKQRRTIQQFTGLGLLGKPIQRVMFHHGSGGNFKSVFLETVTRVLGDSFAIGLPTESLIGEASGSAGGARPDLERVFGKRMLRVSELPEGATLKADLIKKLTGGERWPVRTLYKSFFEFVPIAKPHMSGNGFPKFDGSDGGMRRRLLVAEWPVKIGEDEARDFDIVVAELLEEAPGILNWLIEGALDYLENGLVVADEMRATTEDYLDEMDPVAYFVRDCVEVASGEHVRARELYNAYLAHCQANARRPIFETRFGRLMVKRFKRDDKSVRMYLDVRLHDVPEIKKPSAAAPDPDDYGAESARDDIAPL